MAEEATKPGGSGQPASPRKGGARSGARNPPGQVDGSTVRPNSTDGGQHAVGAPGHLHHGAILSLGLRAIDERGQSATVPAADAKRANEGGLAVRASSRAASAGESAPAWRSPSQSSAGGVSLEAADEGGADLQRTPEAGWLPHASSYPIAVAGESLPCSSTSSPQVQVTEDSGQASCASRQIDADSHRSATTFQSSSRHLPQVPARFSVVGRTMTRLKREYSARASKVMNFEDLSLLRGLPMRSVMHRFGRILQSNAGTCEDYEESAQVSAIDTFLSHTWSTPRRDKFLTLMIWYNFFPAIAVSCLLTLATCLLVSASVLPPVYFYRCGSSCAACENSCLKGGMACQLVGNVTFMLTLFLWHEVAGACGVKGPTVFLDKACVHQTDLELKRKGVQSLAAFLLRSRAMVVLYSDSYLKRLWTVYELASFLLLHPHESMELLPVDLPIMLFALPSLLLLDALCSMISWQPHILYQNTLVSWGVDPDYFTLLLCVAIVVTVLIDRWARILRRIHRRLENFDIRAAECTNEEDRPAVESNVECFVKYIGEVEPDATQTQALVAFNDLVQNTVPQLVAPSCVTMSVRYRVALLIFAQLLFRPFDDLAHTFLQGAGWRHLALDTVRLVAQNLFGMPLLIAVAAFIANHFARLQGVANAFGILANVIAIQLVGHSIIDSLSALQHVAEGSTGALLGFLTYCSCLGLLTYKVYHRPRGSNRRLERGGSSSILSSSAGEGGTGVPTGPAPRPRAVPEDV